MTIWIDVGFRAVQLKLRDDWPDADCAKANKPKVNTSAMRVMTSLVFAFMIISPILDVLLLSVKSAGRTV